MENWMSNSKRWLIVREICIKTPLIWANLQENTPYIKNYFATPFICIFITKPHPFTFSVRNSVKSSDFTILPSIFFLKKMIVFN